MFCFICIQAILYSFTAQWKFSVWVGAFSCSLWPQPCLFWCPRIEWGSSQERDASGCHLMWPKQKLWKKQLSLILRGNTQRLKKKSRLESTRNFPHKFPAFFFCLQTTQNSLISKWFIQSLYENCYKRCLKVIVWKNVNRFEKQGLFKEKRQYQGECQNTSGKKRCWCCTRMCFIGLKWKGSEEKLEFCTHYETIKSRTYIQSLKSSANKMLLLW